MSISARVPYSNQHVAFSNCSSSFFIMLSSAPTTSGTTMTLVPKPLHFFFQVSIFLHCLFFHVIIPTISWHRNINKKLFLPSAMIVATFMMINVASPLTSCLIHSWSNLWSLGLHKNFVVYSMDELSLEYRQFIAGRISELLASWHFLPGFR